MIFCTTGDVYADYLTDIYNNIHNGLMEELVDRSRDESPEPPSRGLISIFASFPDTDLEELISMGNGGRRGTGEPETSRYGVTINKSLSFYLEVRCRL